MANVAYGFELRVTNNHSSWGDAQYVHGDYWSAEACGEQGPDNYHATREDAEAELPNLASVLGCDVADLRVVEVTA